MSSMNMKIFAFAMLPAIAAWSTAPKATLRSLFDRTSTDDVLADPISKQPLRAEVTVVGGLRRERCVSQDGIRYPVNRLYADLVPTSGRSEESLTIGIDELREELVDAWGSRVQTGLFRSPLTAFLYERGWRQNFKAAGFPGIDVEFNEVQRWFRPAAGGVVVDMSCGSGLMTRRLVKSSVYGRVLALDYSEAMLQETARRVQEEGVSTKALTLCRADVAALPLRPTSIDAMHAGAAMHCWPRLEEGLRQIRQVLRPGGLFYATTFLQGAYGSGMPRQTGGSSFRFFRDADELRLLLVDAGFEPSSVTVRIEGRGCAVIKAVAPALTSPSTLAPEEVTMEELVSVEAAAEMVASPPLVDTEPKAADDEAEGVNRFFENLD
ncbi:s-adenosylmethionine-dependent methyltransferase [Chrysochromulina tobinii]|uniref:S-adenosylmethionine-dependent methyltransferase n=1 Tax=Chrysochromulina tobinii TaxID=1460289 RepID=A0A0M0JWJ3_9EUKA|nr:s-adenosylmethionine-dependent methyltransferase [Chrysochromulina tobinii]|eukprot:KOO30692.1 s-adenosylmethionine-dependent methyltransferase [Chrysochromulina sp. CCMP291]